jgi:hypothetical protein
LDKAAGSEMFKRMIKALQSGGKEQTSAEIHLPSDD